MAAADPVDSLAEALAAADPDPSDWIRGIGYTESVAGDLDAPGLDKFRAGLPVRIQHRSGALWILNAAALTAIGATEASNPGVERDTDGRPTGRLWRVPEGSTMLVLVASANRDDRRYPDGDRFDIHREFKLG